MTCFLRASKSLLCESIIWKGSWTAWSNGPVCTQILSASAHYLTGRHLPPPYTLSGSLWVRQKEGLCVGCIWWQTLNTFQHTCALRFLKWGREIKVGKVEVCPHMKLTVRFVCEAWTNRDRVSVWIFWAYILFDKKGSFWDCFISIHLFRLLYSELPPVNTSDCLLMVLLEHFYWGQQWILMSQKAS